MRKILLLTVSVLLIANAAWADHIGIYYDVTGTSLYLPCGFTQTAAIVHKFTLGSTGSRFKLDAPPGSTLFFFNSPFAATGSLSTGIELQYGDCLAGTNALGTIVAFLAPGNISVAPADGFANVIAVNCSFTSVIATGGMAEIYGDCTVATEPTTWGRVKALYR